VPTTIWILCQSQNTSIGHPDNKI